MTHLWTTRYQSALPSRNVPGFTGPMTGPPRRTPAPIMPPLLCLEWLMLRPGFH
jgi:hypothetical protein